ncbi:MAG: glycosyltransferase [Lachnospiraceae bacterium]|nr:glycosyltransferase [Lachnospiraceae bacterium]
MSEIKEGPLITVIIPVYNQKKYITQCLNSVRDQTYRNLEIIIVDDGSNDGSQNICEEISDMDHRMRVIHQKNKGLSAARNKGLDAASGEYIAFVDSDDYIAEKMIEKLYLTLINGKADMSICNIERFDERNKECIPPEAVLQDEVLDSNDALTKLFMPHNWYYVVAWNKLYKSELWKNLRYPVGLIHEDEAVIHHLFWKCQRIAVTSEVLYTYRHTPGSIMNRPYNVTRCDRYYAFADRAAFINKTNREDLLWKAVSMYWMNFYQDYFLFIDNSDKSRLKRMRKTLYRMYPLLVKTHHFASYRDNISTLIFMLNPRIYQKLFYNKADASNNVKS